MQIIDRLKARKLLPIEQHAGTQLESTKKNLLFVNRHHPTRRKKAFQPQTIKHLI